MEPLKAPNEALSPELADDLLRGADEIAKFIFGEKCGIRRKADRDSDGRRTAFR
jgi:hypothetical protein